MNEGLGRAIIAVDDVLMVVQFVDMTHPSQVVAFGISKDSLVLDDPLSNWSAPTCAVVVMHDEVLGSQRVVLHSDVQRASVTSDFDC